MKMKPLSALLLAGGLLAGSVPGRAQAPAPSATPVKAAPAAPRPTPASTAAPAKSATDVSATPAARPEPSATTARPAANPKPEGVGQMTLEFREQGKDLIDKRNALIERLRLAKTDEEKQRIISELRAQQRLRLEQQREIARQIREQMQTSRKETGAAATPR